MTQNFQVHLQGIISLLSNHLYSAPKVFVRELLQNATDAITARKKLEPHYEGKVSIHLTNDERPTLTFEDNGIGLTKEEVQLFLSNIGASTKRDSDDFIGQFGIGLLSCFMVTEEIVMITASAKGGPAIQWRGKEDGTFQTHTLRRKIQPGTTVHILPKEDSVHLFTKEKLTELIQYYGDLLPYSIALTLEGEEPEIVNTGNALFEEKFDSEEEKREALMTFGMEQFDQPFLDYIPLKTANDKTLGVAYILKESPSLANKPNNKVYLKRMLVSDENHDILPQWAFFVQAIVNTGELQPTASRESFYQNKTLEKVRKQMGRCIRNHLVRLHQSDPKMLEKIIQHHRMSMKMLAKDDEEFFRIIVHYLKFPTTFGPMTISEYLTHSSTFFHLPNLEEFEKVRNIAKAQGLAIINSRFDYDEEILEKLPTIYEGMEVKKVDTHTLLEQLENLNSEELAEVEMLLKIAEEELTEFQCKAIARKFEPLEIPALHYMDDVLQFSRYAKRASENLPSLWGNILGGIAKDQGKASLCFNYDNELIRQLLKMKDPTILRHYIRLIYLQSLLLGNYQLTSQEMGLLTEGLNGLLKIHTD